jgi:hypothetical protein
MSLDNLSTAATPPGETRPKTTKPRLTSREQTPIVLEKLPLWEWTKPRKAIFHPGGNRNRVLCEGCGKGLSTFPESIDPEPSFSEDEVNGISLYWCKKCTERLEEKIEREHAAKIVIELRALRASQRRAY